MQKALRPLVRQLGLRDVLVFAAGVALGGLGLNTIEQPKGGRQKVRAQQIPTTVNDSDPVVRAVTGGSPPTVSFRRVSAGHFVAEVDAATRNPRWVAERLTKDSLRGDAKREGMSFKEEPGLPPQFRARLNDYSHSGYDRGHLAPAADHRTDNGAMADTFLLSNIAPQVGAGFNRDYWSRFEALVRACVRESDVEEVLVVTGPLYLPTVPTPSPPPQQDGKRGRKSAADSTSNGNASALGANGTASWVYTHRAIGEPLRWVTVPSHYFKVILARSKEQDSSGTHAVAAFVMPNAAIPADTPVTSFLVPLTILEGLSGLSFFRDLMEDSEKTTADAGLASLPHGVSPKDNLVRILLPGHADPYASAAGSNAAAAIADAAAAFAHQPSSSASSSASSSTSSSSAAAAAAAAAASAGPARRVRHLCAVGASTRCTLPAAVWAEAHAETGVSGAAAPATSTGSPSSRGTTVYTSAGTKTSGNDSVDASVAAAVAMLGDTLAQQQQAKQRK